MSFVRQEEIVVFRRTEGAFDLDTGEYSATTEVQDTVQGNVQPISGKTLERLPEGTRTRAQYSLWVYDPLHMKDQVEYKGKRFEIHESEDWNQASSSLPHLKYVMLRTNNQGHDEVTGGV